MEKNEHRAAFSRWRVVAGFVVFVIALVVAAVLHWRGESYSSATVVVDGRYRVVAEVADTDRKCARGLSGREALGPDEGMWFVFPGAAPRAFWMKEMLFPIDILWVRDGKLVDLSVNLPTPVPGEQLPVYRPAVPADRVLEVPAGYAAAHGLRLGMSVTAE